MDQGNDYIEVNITKNINSGEHDINNICRILSKIKSGEKLKLSFESLDFIKPSGVILLMILCRKAYELTDNKVTLDKIPFKIYNYLKSIKFFITCTEWCELGQFYKSSIFNFMSLSNPYSTVDIMCVSKMDFIGFTLLNNRIRELIDSWLTDRQYSIYKDDLQTALAELCNNSIEHSDSKTYFTLQKYKDEWVELCIGDMGIGISEHLRRKHRWIARRDVDYIKIALDGTTGRQSGHGGFGLKKIQEFVYKYNGELSIHSLKGIVKVQGKKNPIVLERYHSFPGTQCHLILRKPLT